MYERTWLQSWMIVAQISPQDSGVVVVRYEADLERLWLVCSHEIEFARRLPYRRLLKIANGKMEAVEYFARDAPQEVRLILSVVLGAGQISRVIPSNDPGVMTRCNAVTAQGIGSANQVPELGEAVAAHTGYGGSTRRVFTDEIGDDVVRKLLLDVEYHVRNVQAGGHGSGIGYPL